jgi:predicted ATP-binding protein involved in virulence
MKATRLIASNFLGFLTPTEITIRDFRVIVGRNDVGKSAVLKALDLFLNGGTPNEDTPHVKSGSNEIELKLCLSPNLAEVVIDQTIPTTFEAEELVDEGGEVCLKKTWDSSAARPKAVTFIRRKVYDEGDFLGLNERALITACTNAGIDTTKAGGGEFNNVEKREKLRSFHETAGTAFCYKWEKLPTSGATRFKLVHDAVKQLLPRFEYFRADSSLSESDSAIQNYFREVALEALAEIGTDEIEEKIRERLNVVLESISERINRVVPQEETVVPSVEFDWARVIKTEFRTHGDQDTVPLKNRGDGFRRISMMAYFEHMAEQRNDSGRDVIFGIEEPETFLHPAAQEQLFEKFSDLSAAGYQVIVSTHSPIIVANACRDDLVLVERIDGATRVENAVEDIGCVAKDLGVTVDNQLLAIVDAGQSFLLVEGVDDANALKHLAERYQENGLITETFSDINIVILPIGSCGSIKHWVSLDLFGQLSKPCFIFFDSDKKSFEEESPTAAQLNKLGFEVDVDYRVTKKRELENYIAPSAIERLVPGCGLTFGDWDDVKELAKNNSFAVSLGGKKISRKLFHQLLFDDLREAYFVGGTDEFVELHTAVCLKLRSEEA